MVVLHIGGNRFDPLPNDHHTVDIWQQLSHDADEYHVFGRNKSCTFNTSSQGKINLHLVPSVTERMYEFLFTCWLVLWSVHKLRPTHLVVQCPVMGGLPAALASRLWKIPLLVELHGTHYFQPVRKGIVGWLEHRFYRLFSVFAFFAASRIRSLSLDMTNHLAAIYGSVVAAKAVVVPTRVNTEVFYQMRDSYAINGPLRLITVGGLNPNKNHADFISALVHSELDYKLTIVGEGPEHAALTALIEYHKLTDCVRLVGRLDHLSLAQELMKHDVYVHYSKAEGLSRAILEAMACGCPVVTTNVGFIKGVLEDRRNAFVIDEPWDLELVHVLKELTLSESLRQSIGLAGLSTIKSSYDAKKVFQDYRDLIRTM
jgi:glycosyltransferase involved in cell wall biosynthesis